MNAQKRCKSAPRILIAGTNSGCGKTTFVCALLQAFVNRGLDTASFKCGPDYIDPMFHTQIIGSDSIKINTGILLYSLGHC